ncbi:hypothetical protein KUCAC02_014483, partial [Chaenocephalus aceratus]
RPQILLIRTQPTRFCQKTGKGEDVYYVQGSGKQRSKEPKKKNKQRLRFRAQNQHSDHLASSRPS